MKCQRALFSIPDHIHYINCAAVSPLLKAAENAGKQGVSIKSAPWELAPDDFFDQIGVAKRLYAELINVPANQVAVAPSTSYGLSTALHNISPNHGNEIILVDEEFPSEYFSARRWVKEHNGTLTIINRPKVHQRTDRWNDMIIDAINDNTAAVMLSAVHWSAGTLFDLEQIGNTCRKHDAYFIVDGAQAIGAMPFNASELPIDAAICPTYKWLMGPYSMAFAYLSERFNAGKPIEESWMNRQHANKFAELTAYHPNYKAGAQRFNVGQHSYFIKAPMIIEGLNQVSTWDPANIQSYCASLLQPLHATLDEYGIEQDRSGQQIHHICSFELPKPYMMQDFVRKAHEQNVYFSQRVESARISPNVYNTEEDIAKLVDCLRQYLLSI